MSCTKYDVNSGLEFPLTSYSICIIALQYILNSKQ